MHANSSPCSVKAVLFDYGGVLAEEGFLSGMAAIASRNAADPKPFVSTAIELVYDTGYVIGKASEEDFWSALREATGVDESGPAMRNELFHGFKLRRRMLFIVDALALAGVTVAVLSDQTNWLDALETRDGFSMHFDAVFNSFHTGYSKRQPEAFVHALQMLQIGPGDGLLVDDAKRNIAMARQLGLHAIYYQGQDSFEKELREYCPGLGLELA